MSFTVHYLEKIYKDVCKRDPNQPEFQQAVWEVLESLLPLLEKSPNLIHSGIIERIVEPERAIIFRVSWLNDHQQVEVNRGYRVQFNSAIGPYKGGLRFHPSVNLSIMKFLGFEQTLKNALTGLPIGGAKGGSDFDPRGKSDNEIMNFCQSFMTELYRHIGPNVDVPAGDIGVGGREIGYLFGQYKRIRGAWENGVLTGKGISYGGSLIRPEATGYGATYFCEEMLNHFGDTLKGKTVALSGFGNVAWGSVLKLNQMGAKVVTISGPDGYVYDKNGINNQRAGFMLEMRESGRDRVQDYADKFGSKFVSGVKPWGTPVDIVMPCATQNEITLRNAKKIVENGTKYVVEVSNMPTTAEASKFLQKNGVIIAPAKAANAGGVAVSALEMAQNSMRLAWTEEEVDAKLQIIMKNIFNTCINTATEFGNEKNLIMGANIGGFQRVAQAMLAQGVAY